MANSSPRQRLPLWVRITLFASLAVNLVVAGLVVGVFLQGGPGKGPGGAGRELAPPFTRALDADARRKVGQEIRRGLRAEFGRDGHRAEFRAAQLEALVLLRAETFEPDRFQTLMRTQAVRVGEVAQVGIGALTEHLEGLSLAERRAYADRVERHMKPPSSKGF